MIKSRLALSVAVFALVAGTALAADLPLRKAPVVPPPPPPPLWTGFYGGVNAGYAFGDPVNAVTSGSDVADAAKGASYFGMAAAISGTSNIALSNNGFIGGGQIGYNWQYTPNFLMGVETDFQGLTNSSSGSAFGAANEFKTGALVSTTSSASTSIDYFGTARLRVGYLPTPTLLLYATGGVAYAGVNFNYSASQSSSAAAFIPGFGSASASSVRAGWTVGGGVEWMFMPNWSAKLEYLYYDLGGVNTSIPLGTPLLYASSLLTNANYNGHIVRVGVNYHFNFGAPTPVVAKY